MQKPRIAIVVYPDSITWYSDGWADNEALMAKAKKAINDAKDEHEAIRLLSEDFEVVEIPPLN